MFHNDYYVQREAWNSQTAENSARGAFAWGTAHSKGWGEVEIEDAIDFGVTFVTQPIVAYGFALDNDDQMVDGRLPRCSGGVSRWIKDGNDFYVGCHVFVTVATVDPIMAAQSLDIPTDFGTDPGYDITHSWLFTAVAIKDIVG